MSAGKYDIYIEQGADYAQAVNVSLPGVTDLSGYTAEAQIRESFASTNVAATFTCTLSGTTVTLVLNAAETATLEIPSALDSSKFVYDLILIDPNNMVYRILQGAVVVSARVTR